MQAGWRAGCCHRQALRMIEIVDGVCAVRSVAHLPDDLVLLFQGHSLRSTLLAFLGHCIRSVAVSREIEPKKRPQPCETLRDRKLIAAEMISQALVSPR